VGFLFEEFIASPCIVWHIFGALIAIFRPGFGYRGIAALIFRTNLMVCSPGY